MTDTESVIKQTIALICACDKYAVSPTEATEAIDEIAMVGSLKYCPIDLNLKYLIL